MGEAESPADDLDPRICSRCGSRRGSDRPFVEPHLCLACVPTVSELLDLADAAESAATTAKGEVATATLTAAGFQLRGLAAILSRHKQG